MKVIQMKLGKLAAMALAAVIGTAVAKEARAASATYTTTDPTMETSRARTA